MSDLHERLAAAVNEWLERAKSKPVDLDVPQTQLVVRHCEADLRRLERHVPSPAVPEKNVCWSCRRSGYMIASEWPCVEIRDLAAAYGIEVQS